MILSIKATSYVVENTVLCLDQDISWQTDFNDVENDNDEETEIEEIQKVFAFDLGFHFSQNYTVLSSHFTSKENYKAQFLEFTTPPPELA